MEPSEEERSMPPSAYYPEGASALADHNLARRLCQGILLPTDVQSLRSRQVTEMLSRFYPSMVEVSFASPFPLKIFACHIILTKLFPVGS